jgi:hypothetical protein
LPAAVFAFLDGQPLTDVQLEMVRDFCEYYISAPCWRTDGAEKQFQQLRTKIMTIGTRQELEAWLHQSLEVDIDPF